MKEVCDLIASLQRLDAVMDDETRVITCREAAYVLGVSPATVSRYIKEKRLHKVFSYGVYGVKAKEVYSMIKQ